MDIAFTALGILETCVGSQSDMQNGGRDVIGPKQVVSTIVVGRLLPSEPAWMSAVAHLHMNNSWMIGTEQK